MISFIKNLTIKNWQESIAMEIEDFNVVKKEIGGVQG